MMLQKVTFSTVAFEDLEEAGIKRKRLIFESGGLAELTEDLTMKLTNAEAEIADLHSRIKKIYARVNMDHESGSRMILDAILLALAQIVSTKKRGVAILPEMRIASRNEVQISHPASGYELLSGNVDYVVLEYEDEKDNKDRLFSPGGSRADAFAIAKGRLFLLVKAKRQSLELASNIPEAVSQAIALLRFADLPELRFCLSDGERWIFFILKSENGVLTYYESAIRCLSRDLIEKSDLQLREIVQLVREWLRPIAIDLFVLE